MRICSFLPTATEILFALGLGEDVVGVTHECVFPPEAQRKPRVIDTVIDQERMSSDQIHAVVEDHVRRKASLYRVDVELLDRLHPDLIVTQELCEVCAIDASETLRAATRLSSHPKVLALHPHTLAQTLEDILRVGHETGRQAESERVVSALKGRIERVRRVVADVPTTPRVFCLEWLSPPMAAGHWVPEMVELAGGIEVLGKAGEPSRVVTWQAIAEASPEVLMLMPCGFPIARTRRELSAVLSQPEWHELPAVRHRRVWLLDGPSSFNQSGPRLVDGLEVLAGLLHPDRAGHLVPPGAAEPLYEAV